MTERIKIKSIKDTEQSQSTEQNIQPPREQSNQAESQKQQTQTQDSHYSSNEAVIETPPMENMPIVAELPTHFDDLIGHEPIGDFEDDSYSTRRLTKEEFTLGLCTSLQACGKFTGLRTLQGVSAADQHNRDGCHAIYDTCVDIPALHFVIAPGGKWMGRVLAIAAFTVPIAAGVKAEIAFKKEQQGKVEE